MKLILEGSSTEGALNWLQWIAQRSKTKTTTTTTTAVSALSDESEDPFLELLNPSQLLYPGPKISHQTSMEISSSSSAPVTTTPTTSAMASTTTNPGTWSWWTPGENIFS